MSLYEQAVSSMPICSG